VLEENGVAIGVWPLTPDTLLDYQHCGNLDNWDRTWPDITDPDEWGKVAYPSTHEFLAGVKSSSTSIARPKNI